MSNNYMRDSLINAYNNEALDRLIHKCIMVNLGAFAGAGSYVY